MSEALQYLIIGFLIGYSIAYFQRFFKDCREGK